MPKANKQSKEKNNDSEGKQNLSSNEKDATESKNQESAEESKTNSSIDSESSEESTTKSETKPDQESASDESSDTTEKPPELSKDDIIKLLKTFPGVGQVMAERIYDAGFDNREKLLSITTDDLKKITGIGKVTAENIATGMENAVKKYEEPPKVKETAKQPGITNKAMNFFKGTFSKITGFFKGKSPKSKAEPAVKPSVPTQEQEVSGTVEQPDQEPPKADEAVKETYFPEVGAPDEPSEQLTVHESVTIETSDTEQSTESQLEHLTETTSEIMPEPESKLEAPLTSQDTVSTSAMKIDFKESSGLLKWFEHQPNLRAEAGRLLFKAGYNNLDELKEAVVEDLRLVNGISDNEAKTIYEELQRLN